MWLYHTVWQRSRKLLGTSIKIAHSIIIEMFWTMKQFTLFWVNSATKIEEILVATLGDSCPRHAAWSLININDYAGEYVTGGKFSKKICGNDKWKKWRITASLIGLRRSLPMFNLLPATANNYLIFCI